MKSFLEEYGFAILAAIVIILLIAMASPLGDIIRTQLSNIVNKFANSANKKLDAAVAGDATAVLASGKVNIFANSATDRFYVILHGTKGGAPAHYKADSSAGTAVAVTKADEFDKNADDAGYPAGEKVFTKAVEELDSGSEYYIEVVNKGTGEHFFSNRVKKA